MKKSKILKIMDLDEEFEEEVEKEMKKGKNEDELPEDEETKVDLNEENQEILEKIKELKKFEKKMKFTYIVDAEWKKKQKKSKIKKIFQKKTIIQINKLRYLILLNFSLI